MELIVFRGPSATGKSTTALEMYPNHVRVNKDSLRLMYPGENERSIHQRVMDMMNTAADKDLPIVNDNVNLSMNTVNTYIQWATQRGYDTYIKTFFNVPLQEAILRDSLRIASVGKSVITQQYMDFEIYNEPYKNAVIFDIDGTLANIDHRRHYVRDSKKNWRGFFAEMHLDKIVDWVYTDLCQYSNVVLMSGRPAEYRRVTERWLADNNVPYNVLFMRGYNDSRRDDIVKQELYEKYVKPYFNIYRVYDDRPSVIRMWERLGLPVVNCGNGEEF